MTPDNDTIVAISTPTGRGGIGVVRLSGTAVPALVGQIIGHTPEPRRATFADFQDKNGDTLDRGLVLYFPAPNSFTGEHVLELHGHGGTVVLDSVVKRCVDLGARLARPGEFSERAFVNGKLDLAQAEAVADLIDSQTEAAARSAVRSLKGEFSAKIQEISSKILELRVFVEAAIDFPDEEIDFLKQHQVASKVEALSRNLDKLLKTSRQGVLLRDGFSVVLVGPPNAGKSSLMNLLSQEDKAIVTPIPGTTRDLIQCRIQIEGLPVILTDTAGLRKTEDVVEHEGVRRALKAAEEADLILLITEHNDPNTQITMWQAQIGHATPVTLVYNKIDLSGAKSGLVLKEAQTEIYISAKTGAAIFELKEHIKRTAGFIMDEETTVIARRRHLEAISNARDFVEQGHANLLGQSSSELLAEDLKYAHQALGEITGAVTSDALLGKIFSSFCIGK